MLTEEERVLGDTLEAILRTVAIQNAGLAANFTKKLANHRRVTTSTVSC